MTVAQIFGMDQSVISEQNLELGMGGMLEGVCLGYAEECRVDTGALMALTVHTGLLAVGGVFVSVSVDETVTLNAGAALPRYDRIVARRDNATNTVWIGAKEGTPAAAPVPPSLTRAGGVYEISLAKVYVKAGDATISENEIIDERGSPAVCGYISFKAREHVQRAAVEGMRQRGSWSARADASATTALDTIGLYAGIVNWDDARAVLQDADGIALQQDTDNLINTEAYVATAIGRHARSHHPIFECKFKLAQTTQERLLVGLAWMTSILASDADPVGVVAGLTYSSTRPDTNFQFVTSDGGATKTLLDSGIPADTVAHIVRVALDSNSATIELLDSFRNIQARVRITTTLPPMATLLTPASGIHNTFAAVKTIYQYYGEGINRNI